MFRQLDHSVLWQPAEKRTSSVTCRRLRATHRSCRCTSDLLEARLRRIQLGSDPKEIKADLVCQRGVQSSERLLVLCHRCLESEEPCATHLHQGRVGVCDNLFVDFARLVRGCWQTLLSVGQATTMIGLMHARSHDLSHSCRISRSTLSSWRSVAQPEQGPHVYRERKRYCTAVSNTRQSENKLRYHESAMTCFFQLEPKQSRRHR